MNKSVGFLVLLLLTPVMHAGETYQVGYGEYRYGQNETEAAACQIAFEEAKRSALRKKFGEIVVQTRDSVCGDSIAEATGNTCEIYERGFASINSKGFISSFESYKPKITTELGYKLCSVETTFTIREFDGKADPTFEILDFRLLPGSIVRITDTPLIQVKTNRSAFHYVYMWAPDEDAQNYYLIYPNHIDPQNEASTTLEIPSDKKLKRYEIEVSLPKNQDTSHEFLFLLSSKEALEAASIISQKNYQLWLLSLDRNVWTQQKYNYRVIRGDLP